MRDDPSQVQVDDELGPAARTRHDALGLQFRHISSQPSYQRVAELIWYGSPSLPAVIKQRFMAGMLLFERAIPRAQLQETRVRHAERLMRRIEQDALDLPDIPVG